MSEEHPRSVIADIRKNATSIIALLGDCNPEADDFAANIMDQVDVHIEAMFRQKEALWNLIFDGEEEEDESLNTTETE